MARKKITTEKYSESIEVIEDMAIKNVKPYTQENFAIAVNDLSIHVNNAYFRTPFNRCPDCNKGNNAVMASFGDGASNKIGNLKGFQATVGDIIGWNSQTYKGLSVVKSKINGVFELEAANFSEQRKEPAVIEKILIPNIYRPIIGEMATFLTNKELFSAEKLVKIGESEYPSAIIKKL